MRPSSATGVLAIALLVGLMVVSYWAGLRGFAEVSAQEPRYEIERWRNGKSIPDKLRLNAIETGLRQALESDPGNPNLLEDLGRFHAARVERGSPPGPQARAIRQQALAWFKHSLELRPTSAHAYTNVALMKFLQGEIDQEFSGALRQALFRGPWQPQVQLMTIELGLASWQALSEETRAAIRHAMRAQAQWKLVDQRAALLSLLKRYKRLDLECLLAGAGHACGDV